MNRLLSATFDSIDRAELAVLQVRARGIPVESFALLPCRPNPPEQKTLRKTPVVLPGMDGWSGGNVSPIGVPRGWSTGSDRSAWEEQTLQLELSRQDAPAAKVALVSCGGRFVH